MSTSKEKAFFNELNYNQLLKVAKSFYAKKHLGQNFLVDPKQLAFIADALKIVPGEQVLEIGPGLGFLTRYLSQSGAQVTAVELDNQCVDYLKSLKLKGVNLIHGDFLQFNLNQMGTANLKVIGNVPYQITAAILAHLLGEIGKPSPWLSRISLIVMTVQKEVAERFVAQPGGKDYSQISLLASYYTQPRILTFLPAEAFYPIPEVTSAVVEFEILKEPKVECDNHSLLRKLIRAGFSQRRKMLKNNLGFLRLSPASLEDIFERLHIDPQTRAERLSLSQFAILTNALANALNDQLAKDKSKP